ncbi:hypothetical protein [Vibrio gangliei]|uniref:hypothetical protein n=1 Tax=Vibrio gangliei TaxID=2077090 RepID=UPI00130055DD|nr:hypothetical protein [Vibrio gangliei]
MNAITADQANTQTIARNNKFKNAISTTLNFALVYGAAFAFIGLTAFAWIKL